MTAQAPATSCTRHPGMGFVYLCIDCEEELVCTRCVVDTHNGHKFLIIEDFVSDKKVELQQLVDNLCNIDSRDIQKKIKYAREIINENGRTIKQVIANIKNQAQKMKNEIDKCAEKLIRLCYEIEKSNKELLESHTSALERLEEKYRRRIQNLQLTLSSGTNLEVIEEAKGGCSKAGETPVLDKIKTVLFQAKPVSTSVLENLLGSLTIDGQDKHFCPVTKATLVSELTHKSSTSTCRNSQDTTWLSYLGDTEIYRVDQRGNVKEALQTKVKVRNITLSPITGRVWFCCREDKTIREVMDNNTAVTRFVADSVPGSLCITTNNTVVVGMRGKIVMYTTDGQQVESAGARGLCKQGAVAPFHMAVSTLTGDIAATDSEGVPHDDYIAGKVPDKTPHIMVMDKDLNLKFRYPHLDIQGADTHVGSSNTGQSYLFYPTDVCFDAKGSILVAEGVRKSIILIDSYQGDFIRTIHFDDIEPLSICLQTDDTLFVGLNLKKVKVLKYEE